MKVFVYSSQAHQKNQGFIQELLDILHENEVELGLVDSFVFANNDEVNFPPHDVLRNYDDLKEFDADFVFTIGGDGTILKAVTFIRDLTVPVLGFNFGRLGFLATIDKSRIKVALEMLFKGRYTIENRQMLFLETDIPLFGEANFALNDFTLHKRDTSSMVTIHTYINGAFLNSYWADGIIVSTPTGSTGYSLSCGGPIVFPGSGNFLVTPVAPHNLNVRPVVISDDSVLSFEIEGRSDNFLCTLDSRNATIGKGFQLAVRKCDFVTKLVKLDDVTFLKTIHEKLAWGIDKRNIYS
jgi:NAD+ kinase